MPDLTSEKTNLVQLMQCPGFEMIMFNVLDPRYRWMEEVQWFDGNVSVSRS